MATPPPAQNTPQTTIVPFADTAKLPQCAVSCAKLYDANANCVPPAIPTNTVGAYEACFCLRPEFVPFTTGVNGVCDGVCDDTGKTSIANWYSSLCSLTEGANGGPASVPATATSTGKGGKQTGTSSGASSSSNNGDWISNHWQWVVMIVILVVGIAAIWIGACIWRRRYLRRKDRQSTLGQKQSGSASHPSWGPGLQNSESGRGFYAPPQSETMPSFVSSEEKPRKQKKKWTVTSRT